MNRKVSMFPTKKQIRNNRGFTEYALMVNSWFRKFPKLNITPFGLEQLILNHVVVAPMSADPRELLYYGSVFHCNLCDVQARRIKEIQDHCQEDEHQRKLFETFKESVKRPVSDQSDDIYSLSVSAPENSKTFSCATMWDANRHASSRDAEMKLHSLPSLNVLVCDLCDVSTRDPNLFLLHLRGFGHLRRQSARCRSPKYQPLRDAQSGSIFYLDTAKNLVMDSLPDHVVLSREPHALCQISKTSLIEFIGSQFM